MLTYTAAVDEVFRALDDPSRRLLLDKLFEEDGQTLSELTAHLPTMTRYGVMNHLGVLAEGGLITTKRVGRKKHHYLNPVPIRLVHDRWINKFTEPRAASLAELSARLDRGRDATATTADDPGIAPVHAHETYIAGSPTEVWDALTGGEPTILRLWGAVVTSEWTAGAGVAWRRDHGPADRVAADGMAADGEVLVVEEPNRLEWTLHPRWDPELEAEGSARMSWRIDDQGGRLTRVRVECFDLDPDGRLLAELRPGIALAVAGLKTLVETGSPMTTG